MALLRLALGLITLCILAMPAAPAPISEEANRAFTDAEPVPPPQPSALYSYRGYSQIRVDLLNVEAQHPDIAKVYDIGDSWEKTQNISNRDILALKISDNVAVDENEPEVLIMGLHHAREWISSEVVMGVIRNLTDAYGNDSRLSWLVDNRELWIVPVVNPDGLDYALSSNSWWRKNRHLNYDGSYGVDLNRNYNGSVNNDSAGAWGGAGSYSVPSNDEYRGTSPFSEPETQSIRDLVMTRDFSICLDFHSFGELVMWPWGYTTNVTPDDAALVSIGTQLAALNGYTAEQSIGLYPTTGDSLDWLYGYDNIFGILFEVALNDFHPTNAQVAEGVVAENIPPSILGIEIAGDKYQRQFTIEHTASATRDFSVSGFTVSANITAARGVDVSALNLVYRVEGGTWNTVPMARIVLNDTYSATIPAQNPGSLVEYYIVAHDTGDVELMSPRYAPYEIHSFAVVDTQAPVADAGDDVSVTLGSSVPLDGSASTDNFGIVNFTWTFTYNGSEVVLYGENATFSFWTAGAYDVTLEVADSSGNRGSDVMVVRVEEPVIPEFGGLVVAMALLIMILSFWLGKRR